MITSVGIDPGITGALAVIDSGEIEIHDAVTQPDGKRRKVNAGASAALLRDIQSDCKRDGKQLLVTLERSHAMPPMGFRKNKGGEENAMGHGSIGSFSLGYSFGMWVGVIETLEIPLLLVAPPRWKKDMMNGAAKGKDASRDVCDKLFPGQRANWWARKLDHNRCDALLLASWGMKYAAANSGILEE